MFVLHHTRQGFIHIARTGGRYVESQCEHLPDFELILPRHRFRESLYPDYEWHMVVRDPIDRFVSIYQLWRQTHANEDPIRITHSLTCPQSVFNDLPAFVEWFCQRHIRYASHWTEQHRYWDLAAHVWTMDRIDQLIIHLGSSPTGEIINQNINPPPMVTASCRKNLIRHYEGDHYLFDFGAGGQLLKKTPVA